MESDQGPSIDAEEIRRRTARFDGGVRNHLSNGAVRAVLVLGATRSGKSTVMNIIAGKEIEVKEIDGCDRINVVGEEYAGIITAIGFEPIKIVHGTDSGTTFPNYVKVNGDHYWDCPGNFDNRCVDTAISNCYFVHTLLHNASEPDKKGVKFVLVQDYAGVRVTGGQSFTDMIETICTIFEPKSSDDFNKLIDATTFVFNMVDEGKLPNEDSRETFIRNIIKRVSTSMDVKQIEKLSSKKRARIAFIEHMWLKVEDLRYVAVPAARLSVPVSAITERILDPASGIIQKVESCRPISGWKPKLSVVGEESLIAVLNIQKRYVNILTGRVSDQLQGQLRKYFVSIGLERTLAFVDEVRPFLIEDKVSIDRGGANRASLQLVKHLQDKVEDKNVKLILDIIEIYIEKIRRFDMLIRNARSGFDFTMLITAVQEAARNFLTESDILALDKFSKDMSAYIEEQNRLNKVAKVFAAPAWLVTATIHGAVLLLMKPCALAEQKLRNIKEEDTISAAAAKATEEVLHYLQGEVYGYRNRPNLEELNKEREKIEEKKEVLPKK